MLNNRDDRVHRVGNVDRHHKIWRNWSEGIQDNFENQMSRRLLRKSTGPDKIIDVLCEEVRKLVEKNIQIEQDIDELACEQHQQLRQTHWRKRLA